MRYTPRKGAFIRPISTVLFLALLTSAAASVQVRVEKNVVYGMYSGLALLTDVHHPALPNGYGLIVVPGNLVGLQTRVTTLHL